MIRLLVVGRRAPGITRRAAHRHLRESHGRLVLCQPPDAGAPIACYTQNHVVDGVYFATGGVHAVERDLLTELCFDSPDDMRAGLASAYYRTTLAPDERRFVDDDGAVKMMVESHAVSAGPRTAHKLFALLGRGEAVGDEAWRSATTDLAGTILPPRGVRRADAAPRAAAAGRRAVRRPRPRRAGSRPRTPRSARPTWPR